MTTSDRLYQLLSRIHKETLDRFTYLGDKENFDLEEHWPDPRMLPDPPKPFTGDCDDFALMCRKELKKHNIINRLVYCKVETGGGHLVCEVNGWILDNRCWKVAKRDDLPYTWIAISGYEKDQPWRKIEN
jgi:predicted transglutaminase-like cysteine proteinase